MGVSWQGVVVVSGPSERSTEGEYARPEERPDRSRDLIKRRGS